MLAYLFYHRPQLKADRNAYEDALRRFHAELASARPAGFRGSSTYRVADRYCDWYLIETSAALDALNDSAVSGARSVHHDSVARLSAEGDGKLLRLTSGTYDAGAEFDIRFSKPRGMSYRELYRSLERWTSIRKVSLWRRMMVLGPPPELCMLAQSEQVLPQEFGPVVFRREPI